MVEACGGSIKGRKLAILGLTFKQNTDDMRDAPSLTIIPALQKQGAKITAYDPQGMEEAAKQLNDVKYYEDPYEAIEGADALVIVTEWDQFRALDLDRVKKALKYPVIVDLRNIYNPEEMESRGFHYIERRSPHFIKGSLKSISSISKDHAGVIQL